MDKTFNEIFKKTIQLIKSFEDKDKTQYLTQLGEYDPTEGKILGGPVYQPTSIPKTGPRPITIEEYKARTANKNQPEITHKKKKKSKGGKRNRLNKEIKELRRLIPLSSGENKHRLYLRLRELTKKE